MGTLIPRGESWFALDYSVDYATQRPSFSYLPDSDSAVSPDMAALTDGGRALTVHIRKNVHFSPPVNRAVTSADIAYPSGVASRGEGDRD
jgi:peptide/nickel transport system substrate-binding protein